MIVGEVGDRLRVYLYGVPPTATALLEILILENYHDEKKQIEEVKLIGSSEINPKIVNCVFGCIVLVDDHIMICTL